MNRPFRAPLSMGRLSVTGAIGMVSCLALLTQFDILSASLGQLPILGIVIYLAVNRKDRVFGVDKSLHEKHEK